MRKLEKQQTEFGETAISGNCIAPNSRDDIPTVLKGLQLICTTSEHRERVFELLIEYVLAGIELKVGMAQSKREFFTSPIASSVWTA